MRGSCPALLGEKPAPRSRLETVRKTSPFNYSQITPIRNFKFSTFEIRASDVYTIISVGYQVVNTKLGGIFIYI